MLVKGLCGDWCASLIDHRGAKSGVALRPYGLSVVRRFRQSCSAPRRIDVPGLGAGVVPAPTPQQWEVPTMSESMALMGLDVHQAQTVAAVLDPRDLERLAWKRR